MANKPVEFKTKLIHEGKVYLKLSDVVKALGYKYNKEFFDEHSSLVNFINGIRCVKETDYNKLLSANESALSNQGQIEVTKVETLHSKVKSVLDFQPLKFLFARDYLKMMAVRTGCKSEEDYIITHELPKEKHKALMELIQSKGDNTSYKKMIAYLQDKEQFDIDKIRSFGLDVQYLISIESDGDIDIDAYVVGKGVFHSITDFGDYALWNEMYIDEHGDVILPWCDYDYQKERLINISKPEVDRDFSKYNVIENMLWCIDNLEVTALEDYEYAVFGYYGDTIDFSMGIELLVKILKPDAIDTIYTDKLIDVENELYMTEFNSEKVFKEDYED